MYTDQLLDHFRNPRNAGDMHEPDGTGTIGRPECGDVFKINIKVNNEIIEDITFQTFGCAAAIATSSMTTILAKGKNIQDAFRISRKDVAESLGGLPDSKMHCSNYATSALQVAINDYLEKQGRPPLGEVALTINGNDEP